MEVESGGLSPSDFRYTDRTTIQCSENEYRFLSVGATLEFDWKDYSPAVFRHIQAMDGINYDDYIQALCGQEVLHGISSATRPGSLHHLPQDDRFVIKTLKKSEVKLLLEMLPNYYQHIKSYRSSLLIKFYGLHFVRRNRGLKVYFVVMSNILKSDQYIHLRFDLKGSSQGRSISKLEFGQQTILKDPDLDFCFYLDPLIRVRLLRQIKYDCEFLEAEGIMDYSLLLGIHVETSHQGLPSGRQYSNEEDSKDQRQPPEDLELTMSGICEPRIRFGVKMPARAIRTPQDGTSGSISVAHQNIKTREGYNVFLYFGMIDILQSYGMGKRIEHAYKSLHYDSWAISAVNPKAYSSRFQEFLGTIFQESGPDL